jgi:hypothetical protein
MFFGKICHTRLGSGGQEKLFGICQSSFSYDQDLGEVGNTFANQYPDGDDR